MNDYCRSILLLFKITLPKKFLMTSSRCIPRARQSRHFLHADHPVPAPDQVGQRFTRRFRKQQARASDDPHHHGVTNIGVRKMDFLQRSTEKFNKQNPIHYIQTLIDN